MHHARRRRRDHRGARPGGEGRPGRDDEALRPGGRGDARRACPATAADLRYVSVVVNDPEFEPYFEPGDIVRGSRRAARADRGDAAAGGRAGRAGRRLRRRGRRPRVQRELPRQPAARPERRPRRARAARRAAARREVVAGDWWNEGRAVYGALRLQNGARVDGAWIQLLDTFEYRETIQFMFADEVHSLEFPSPWLKQHPTVYRRSRRDGRIDDVRDRQRLRRVVLARAAALPRLHRRRDARAARRPRARGSTSTC